MKFLIISNLYEPLARGGAEAVVKTTAEGLVTRGHEVVVLTAGPRSVGLQPQAEQRFGVRVLRFFPWNIYFVHDDWKFPKVIRALARLIDLFNWSSARMVGKVIDHEQPDVVITHNLVGFGLLTPWMIRRKNKKHFHVLHDVQLIYPSGLLMWGAEKSADKNLLRKTYERLTKRLMGSPYAVIAPSRWLLDLHVTRGFFSQSKKEALPNPVDGLANSVVTKVLHQPLRLLYAGQLETHKGINWLMEQMILNKDEDCILEIAGSGSLEDKIKSMALAHPNQIIFYGKLGHEALMEKMNEADVLVVPSFCYENSPRIISEAQSLKLPIVASRIGGISELVQEGKNGFLFTPGHWAEFKMAVVKLGEISFDSKSAVMTVDQYLDKMLVLV